MGRLGRQTDRRGLSNVVGVLLMVAVTVILGATVGAFVFDIGEESTDMSPQIGWEYDYNDGNVTATFIDGDETDAAYLTIEGDCAVSSLSHTGTIDGGTSIQIGDSCDPGNETLRIIWNSPESDQSAVIGQFEN